MWVLCGYRAQLLHLEWNCRKKAVNLPPHIAGSFSPQSYPGHATDMIVLGEGYMWISSGDGFELVVFTNFKLTNMLFTVFFTWSQHEMYHNSNWWKKYIKFRYFNYSMMFDYIFPGHPNGMAESKENTRWLHFPSRQLPQVLSNTYFPRVFLWYQSIWTSFR